MHSKASCGVINKERKMVNVKLGNEMTNMQSSSCTSASMGQKKYMTYYIVAGHVSLVIHWLENPTGVRNVIVSIPVEVFVPPSWHDEHYTFFKYLGFTHFPKNATVNKNRNLHQPVRSQIHRLSYCEITLSTTFCYIRA